MEPLANKIRPASLDEFVGQEHLVGEGKPLKQAMQNRHLFSFILWGPPGVGKTTLARIYAKAMEADYHELSAVSAGKEDIRKIISNNPSSRADESARYGAGKFQISNHNLSVPAGHLPSPLLRQGYGGQAGEKGTQKPKILFLDEIHRFNKAQQDFLLPFVERGEL